MKNILLMSFAFIFLPFVLCSTALAAPLQVAVIDPVQLVDKYDSVEGLRLDLIYGVNYNVTGVDIGLFNKVESRQKGLQIGLYNNSGEVTGLQIGLVNRTYWLDGVQIGLVNIHEKGDLKFFPVINFSF